MRVRRILFASLLASTLATTLLGGCGGGQSGPRPLSRHFDDSYIASISTDEKAGMIKAESDWSVAKLEQGKAEADLRDARLLFDVARNERDSARLDEKSAASRKKAADASADQGRIAQASKEIDGTSLARSAADERVNYLQAYMRWLDALVRYTAENTYWRESQVELAKAQLAHAKTISPKGFVFDDYTRQEGDRQHRASDAKDKADHERKAALAARDKWIALQGSADKTLGKKSEFPDPLAPKPEGDPLKGGGGYTPGGAGAASDAQVPTPDNPTRTAPTEPATDAGSGQ